jgi:hypothetical protein
MDLARLLQMIGNMVMRALMQLGLRRGVDVWAGKGKAAAEMTPAEKQAAKQARKAIKRARQAARITRRLR